VTGTSFDIAVIGGGLSGGLAALALARAGFAVALVDAEEPSAMQAEAFDGRTTAIAYASARAFMRLGLWDSLAAEAAPIFDILVTDGRLSAAGRSGGVSPLHLHFDSRELSAEGALGYIVENRVLRSSLYKAIPAEDGVSLFAPAARKALRFDAGRAVATLADGREISAALIIAADGRHSSLRAEAGIKTNAWTYPQTGIVTTLAHEHPHRGVAQELFLPAGPFAILPMTDNRSSIVWTERADAAPAFLALPNDEFLRAAEQRFGDYLGRLSLAGPRWSYPLAFHLAHRYVAPRLALIGDAAHAIHPIAGQGYNLGVKDIAALVDTLVEARRVGLDIGGGATLENYERWRRFDSAALAFGTDALNRLFSNDSAPLRLARDVGMSIVDRIGPLRTFFMRQAGADVGRLPALMAPLSP